MSSIKSFMKHIETHLQYSRKKLEGNRSSSSSLMEESQHVPPSVKELENLIQYLQSKGVNPIIVGSLAIAHHLKVTKEKVDKSFRATEDLDLFVSTNLPSPPFGWKRDQKSIGLISWISPSGGYVDFLVAGHRFPDNHINPQKLGVDKDSMEAGCPVADIAALFQLKLNSYRTKDLTDLVALAREVGIPKELRLLRLNQTQKDNLQLVDLWINTRPRDE